MRASAAEYEGRTGVLINRSLLRRKTPWRPTSHFTTSLSKDFATSRQDTVKQAKAAKKAGSEAGVTLKEIVWTQGQYDIIAISETSDETMASAYLLNVLKAGNLRAQTLRAFTTAEMEKILEKVA